MRRYSIDKIEMMASYVMCGLETKTLCVHEWDVFINALNYIEDNFFEYTISDRSRIIDCLNEFDKSLDKIEMRIDLVNTLRNPINMN